MHNRIAVCLGWMALVAATMPGVAQADERIATSECPNAAPVWRVEYRTFYSVAGEKARFLPSLIPTVAAEAAAFAQDVGRFTKCAMRVQVDLVDRLPAYGPDTVPDVHDGYDSYVTMVPEDDDHYRYEYDDRISPGIRIHTRTQAPTRQDLMRVWLQELKDFYRTPLGWPSCVPWACTESDLGAILTGTYLDSRGRQRGMPRQLWAYQGTPRDPRHQALDVSVRADQGRRRGIRVWWFPDGYPGPLDVSYFTMTGKLLYRHSLTARFDWDGVHLRAPLAVGYGLVRICVRTRTVSRFESGMGCVRSRFRPSSGDLLSARRVSPSRLMLRATGPLLGRRMTYRAYSVRDLVMNRPTRRRTIRLRRTQVLRIPARNSLLDVRLGAFVWRAHHFPRYSWTVRESLGWRFG